MATVAAHGRPVTVATWNLLDEDGTRVQGRVASSVIPPA